MEYVSLVYSALSPYSSCLSFFPTVLLSPCGLYLLTCGITGYPAEHQGLLHHLKIRPLGRFQLCIRVSCGRASASWTGYIKEHLMQWRFQDSSKDGVIPPPVPFDSPGKEINTTFNGCVVRRAAKVHHPPHPSENFRHVLYTLTFQIAAFIPYMSVSSLLCIHTHILDLQNKSERKRTQITEEKAC